MLKMKLRMTEEVESVTNSINENGFEESVDNSSVTDAPRDTENSVYGVYDLPWTNKCLHKSTCSKYIPFLPTYDETIYRLPKKCQCSESPSEESHPSVKEEHLNGIVISHL